MLEKKFSKRDTKLVESSIGDMFIVPTEDIYEGLLLKGTNVVGDENLVNIIDELKEEFLSKSILNYEDIGLEIMCRYNANLVHDSFLKTKNINKYKYKYIYNLEDDAVNAIDFSNYDIVSFYQFTWYPQDYPIYFETVFGIKNILDVIEMDHFVTDSNTLEREYENGYSYEVISSITTEYHLYKKDSELIFCKSQKDNLDGTLNSSLLTVEALEKHEAYSYLQDMYNAGKVKELISEYNQDDEDIPF